MRGLVVLATVAGTDPEASKGVAADCFAYRGYCGMVYTMTKVTVLDVTTADGTTSRPSKVWDEQLK